MDLKKLKRVLGISNQPLQSRSRPQISQMSSNLGVIEENVAKFKFEKVEKYLTRQNDGNVKARIEEFKRFITLKALFIDVSASILSPSLEVDKVWQAVLQFPLDYVRFCDAILPIGSRSRIIDYNPFGADDVESQPQRYKKTLEAYRQFFKREPPRAYWESLKPVPKPNACVTAPKASDSGVKPDDNKAASKLVPKPNACVTAPKAPDSGVKPDDTKAASKPVPIRIQNNWSSESMTRKLFTVTMLTSDTVENLKKKISTNVGIALEQQRLGYCGQTLEDSRTLESYDIKGGKGCTVRLALTKVMQNPSKPVSVGVQMGNTYDFESAFFVEMFTSDTVKSLKMKIYVLEGVPLEQQRLIYCKQIMEDTRTLQSYNIEGRDLVHLILNKAKLAASKLVPIHILTRDYYDDMKREYFTVPMFISDTVENLKLKIQLLEGPDCGLPLEQQVLYYCGRTLKDFRTLQSYNIQEGSTLQLATIPL